MIVKLLTEHHLEFLSLKGDCRGSSESTHVKMPHCWKSHAQAHHWRVVVEEGKLTPKEAVTVLPPLLMFNNLPLFNNVVASVIFSIFMEKG